MTNETLIKDYASELLATGSVERRVTSETKASSLRSAIRSAGRFLQRPVRTQQVLVDNGLILVLGWLADQAAADGIRLHTMNHGKAELPMPPYPAPEDSIWMLLLRHLARQTESHIGEQLTPMTLREILILAAAHGWYEGYINAAGESARPVGPVDPALTQRFLERTQNSWVG